MKTPALTERKLLDCTIRQNSKTAMLSVNDLLIAGNNWRALNKMSQFNYNSWYTSRATKEFIAELEKVFGVGNVVKARRGNQGSTWFHPYLFIDLALAISPKLKVEVYSWLYDELLKYRNFSGDSYRKMCGVLYDRTTKKSTFSKSIVDLANRIQNECGVRDWEAATEEQLKLRDKIHNNIALLGEIMGNLNEAIRLGIHYAKNS